MTALTVNLADENYLRLKEFAQQRGTTIDQLINEMATLILAELDAETRFMIRA